MTRATRELRTAAERLLLLEVAARSGRGTKLPAAVGVSDRIRRVLVTLLGTEGFRALLARAVTLAKAEAPELKAVQVAADGSLEGLVMPAEREARRPFAHGEVVLVAHILGLLLTFVGEALMIRLVNDAWPKAKLDDLDFDGETTP